MKRIQKDMHLGFLLLLSLVIFLAVILHGCIAILIVYFLICNDIIVFSGTTVSDAGYILSLMAAFSFPLGMVVAFLVSKVPLKPLRNLIYSMDRLASGDFQTRVNVGNVMRRYPPFVDIARSFNKMAEQLESTEMLRSDFINNFSHEFKTPIVSIAGFAKLLQKEDLPPELQKEYLTAIEEESMRLSYMATNVLNLTKVENQTILSDVSSFNLSEQIRSCILLLEKKWEQKQLELQLDLAEYTTHANEELLKQVWINLLDNAIKFAPVGHTVKVQIRETGSELVVDIRNTGSEISEADQERIFNKFFQADASHATEGNGVGLAIVKRIVDLHGGEVRVHSSQDVTTFTVTLPR